MTPKDSATAPAHTVSSSASVSAKIASVGPMVSAKVKMVGVWFADRRGQKPSA